MSIIKKCQICSGKIKFVLSLGKQPLCDDLIKIRSKKKNLLFPINIFFCKKCLVAYNQYLINPKKLFPKSYHYRSRFTKDVLHGMRSLVDNIILNYGSIKNKTVLDIGSNDGSLLNFFKKKKSITIGVEPTRAATDNKQHKIYQSFFDYKLAKKIKKKYNKIDYIVFTNVFAHINNLKKLIKNLKILISENTRLVIENHYLGSVLKKSQFDTFYHEHPRTYSLKSFYMIAQLLEMNIDYISFPKRYGGNIRVILSKKQKNNQKKFKKILNKEKTFFLKLLKLNNKIEKWKSKMKKKIIYFRKKGYKFVGKAFPGRASILINLLNLNNKDIICIYEKPNSLKVGNYVPNTNIPIISDASIHNVKNKKIIIINFAWHIKKEIICYLRDKGLKNKIINIL